MKRMGTVNRKNGISAVRWTGFLSVAILLSGILAGCKSVETAAAPESLQEVHPLALLSDDSSIYVHVPVAKHRELTAALLCDEVSELSASDAKRITERISQLYIGVGTVRDRSRLEAAASGSIPQVLVKTTLTEKNGWSQQRYDAQSDEHALSNHYPHSFTFYTHGNKDDVNISFMSDSVLCFAKHIFPLLEKYALRPEVPQNPCGVWISQESDDILFYITRPGQYLRSLIGQSVTIGSDCIYGTLSYIPDQNNLKNYSGNYTMSFRMHVTDRRAMPAFRSLLSLSFGMVGGKVSQVDDNTIELSGVVVSQQQIEEMFIRDKITGRHYKVVDDKVIEEAE